MTEQQRQAEFERVTDDLCNLDRQIEQLQDDMASQFGYGAPKADQTDGYARAYRDRERMLEMLRRDVARLEAYQAEIA